MATRRTLTVGSTGAHRHEEVFTFITELERPAGTYLYGRRMYETMLYWESAVPDEGYVRAFAEMWRDADKVVYSRSLESVSSARTRLEHDFDPEAVRRLKAAAARRSPSAARISLGRPSLPAS